MEFMTKIFGWMLAPRPAEPSRNHPELYPLDLDTLKAELDIEHQARRLGEVGLPKPTDSVLSGPENSIVQRLEGERRDYLNWATLRLKNIHTRMHGCDITKTVNRALEAAHEFERTANSRLGDYQVEVARLKTAALEREEALRLFRLDNDLNAAAKVVSAWRHAALIFLTLLIVFIEGALNANFFARSLDGGLIQGFGYAFGLALMNVSAALAIGHFGLTQKNHVKPLRRLIGYLSLPVALALMTLMGLVIAHFRDSLAQGLDSSAIDPGALALHTLVNSPLVLSDIYSWLLFAFSLFFGLISFAEGYYWLDRYPGYSRVQQAADKAVDEYEECLGEVRETLEELKNEHLTALENNLDQARASVLGYKEQIQEKRSTRLRLQQALHKAENMLDALIAIFRTDNTLHRRNKGGEVPAYFAHKVEFQPIELPDFDTCTDEAALLEQEQMLARLLERVEQIRAEIQASYDQKFDQYQSIRDQLR